MSSANTWNDKIENVLDNIRVNALYLSTKYKGRYFSLSNSIKWYRLPIIILSGANSIIAVGLQPYIEQGTISLTNSLIALICGIIGSIELFLKINARCEADLITHKELYLLSIEIFKTLSLDRENRYTPAKEYLEQVYNDYCKIIESSNPLYQSITDKLLPINFKILDEGSVPHARLNSDTNPLRLTHSAEESDL
jgi:hypothetical protein